MQVHSILGFLIMCLGLLVMAIGMGVCLAISRETSGATSEVFKWLCAFGWLPGLPIFLKGWRME